MEISATIEVDESAKEVTATFDLYDLPSFEPPELTLSRRVFIHPNERQTPNQYFEFSTLFQGGYSAAASVEIHSRGSGYR